MSKTLKFGVIGAGYMGKAYAIALNTVASVYSLSAKPVLELIATSSADGAARKADAFGFKRATGSWQALVADADVDVADVAQSRRPLERDLHLRRAPAGPPPRPADLPARYRAGAAGVRRRRRRRTEDRRRGAGLRPRLRSSKRN